MPHARRTWLWRLRRASLLLLLGLGTTVAVAWTAEAWSPMRQLKSNLFRNGPEEWFVDVPSRWPTAPEWDLTTLGIGRTARIALRGDFGRTVGSAKWKQEEVRVGFPLRSIRRVMVLNEPGGQDEKTLRLSRVQTGLTLPAWPAVFPYAGRRLPLLPLWPGLVANTLIYGLLWWLGLAARRMVICNRRFRRGLCPICRYDLGFNNTAGCPECGWRRE